MAFVVGMIVGVGLWERMELIDGYAMMAFGLSLGCFLKHAKDALPPVRHYHYYSEIRKTEVFPGYLTE